MKLNTMLTPTYICRVYPAHCLSHLNSLLASQLSFLHGSMLHYHGCVHLVHLANVIHCTQPLQTVLGNEWVVPAPPSNH
jgi:hypothetical protein